MATSVVVVSEGYPGSYAKGKVISLPQVLNEQQIFHAGTKAQDNQVLSAGGRVLVVSSLATTQEEALRKSYQTVEAIDFEGKHYRSDIGFDLK